MPRDYRNIKAWVLADELTKKIYEATRSFPREEIYGVTSQLRRAAVSVPCNIVEGSSRKALKEYLHFLYIAKGSLAETEYLVSLSLHLSFINQTVKDRLMGLCDECARTLSGLIKAVAESV